MEAYCLKCREKREMKDEHPITMKNGKPATQGVCPTCGTKMFKIGGGAAKEGAGASSSAKEPAAKTSATKAAPKAAAGAKAGAVKSGGSRAKASAGK